MADTGEIDELTEDMPDGLARKKWTGKKIVLIAAPVLLVLIGVGVVFSMGLFSGGVSHEGEEHAAALDEETQTLFYDVPEMLVNLNTTERKATYLKISVALEVDRQSSVEALDENLPRVMDNFQVYLRELRVEDLSGSAGLFRLKEELLHRVNQAIEPARVEDVLFKEMLVQ